MVVGIESSHSAHMSWSTQHNTTQHFRNLLYNQRNKGDEQNTARLHFFN